MPTRTLDYVVKVCDILRMQGFGPGCAFALPILENMLELHVTRKQEVIDRYVKFMIDHRFLIKKEGDLWTIDFDEVNILL
jgi:hypothetical protein